MDMSPIPIFHLGLALVPPIFVFFIFLMRRLDWKEFLFALARMVLQLLGVGYILHILFSQDEALWTFAILSFMMSLSAWIALRSIKTLRFEKYKYAFLSQLLGPTPVLIWVVGVVLPNSSWSDPRFIIPLGGMIYASAMNTLGLAAERFSSELSKGVEVEQAEKSALIAAFIPHINMLMAVGLVSLPGLMTGQILSGVSPLIAVQYQIVIMTMILSASVLSSFLFIQFWKASLKNLDIEA